MSLLRHCYYLLGPWLYRNRKGQDLLEFALLAGFVAVAAGVIFPTYVAPTVSNIFVKARSVLDARVQ